MDSQCVNLTLKTNRRDSSTGPWWRVAYRSDTASGPFPSTAGFVDEPSLFVLDLVPPARPLRAPAVEFGTVEATDVGLHQLASRLDETIESFAFGHFESFTDGLYGLLTSTPSFLHLDP